MYGLDELKPTIRVNERQVECPVKGCRTFVERQRRHFCKQQQFFCPVHDIYISPSTHEYGRIEDALLQPDPLSLELLSCMKGIKRESGRLARENSEDAVTWNVFRALNQYGLTVPVLSGLLKVPLKQPKMIFWSFDVDTRNAWQPLLDARLEFGESTQENVRRNGTEPDLILLTDRTLIFIEAKLTASNKVPGGKKDIENTLRRTKRYLIGGDAWFPHTFARTTSFEQLVRDQKYELMRMWLLGSWIAKSRGLSFILVNLVREEAEQDIEHSFGQYLDQQPNRTFRRLCWEEIFRDPVVKGKTEARNLREYGARKTVGYKGGGLVKAFNI